LAPGRGKTDGGRNPGDPSKKESERIEDYFFFAAGFFAAGFFASGFFSAAFFTAAIGFPPPTGKGYNFYYFSN
jgi:hypothetical protein